MPRPLILLLASCLITATLYADAPDPKKLPVVKKTLDKAVAAVRRNRKAYDEANAEALAEAEKSLKQEVDRLSKASKPEEAVAVKNLIASLRDQVVAMAEESGGGTAPPKAPPTFAELLVGKWDSEKTPVVRQVEADGTVTEYRKSDFSVKAKGKITKVEEQVVIVELESKFILQFARNGNAVLLKVFNPSGKVEETVTLQRLP